MYERQLTGMRVCALGFDARSHGILESALAHRFGAALSMAGDDEADVSLIDMDCRVAAKIFKDQRLRFPDRILVLLAEKPQREFLSNTVYLLKPVATETLVEVLERAAAFLASKNKRLAPCLEASGPFAIQNLRRFVSPDGDRSFKAFFASLKVDAASQPAHIEVGRYSAWRYLQGYLQAACETALQKGSAMRMETGWKPITILPDSQEVWLDADEDELQEFCSLPIDSVPKTDPTGGPTAMSLTLASNRVGKAGHEPAGRAFPMDAVLWKAAVWAANGRLTEDVDLLGPIFMRRWPNFTRLLPIPHGLRIAAVLADYPRSLLEIIDILAIEPGHAFDFFNAARAIGIVGQSRRKSEVLMARRPAHAPANGELLQKAWNYLATQ
jgi:hypothetical protein